MGPHRARESRTVPSNSDGRRPPQQQAIRQRARDRARTARRPPFGNMGGTRGRYQTATAAWTVATASMCHSPTHGTGCGTCGSPTMSTAGTTSASRTKGCGRCATRSASRRCFGPTISACTSRANARFAAAVVDEAGDEPVAARARPGLPFRARAADAPASAAHQHRCRVLAHSVAPASCVRALPVAGRAPRRAARQRHRRPADTGRLPQFHRYGRVVP